MPWISWYELVQNPWRSWQENIRPFPELGRKVYSVPLDSELAILHIDHDTPYDVRKRSTFEGLEQSTRHIKKRVAINHGVPISDFATSSEVIEAIKKMVGEIPMVVNSFQARKMWGWGHPIIHGYRSGDFMSNGLRLPRVIMCMSAFGMKAMYNRNLVEEVEARCRRVGINFQWIGRDVPVFKSWQAYREYLNESLIYLHLSAHSPMPRARTEAMFSGCHVVTVNGHGFEDMFDDSEITLVPEEADVIVDRLRMLLADPAGTRLVAIAGEKAALRRFNWGRYTEDWTHLIAGL